MPKMRRNANNYDYAEDIKASEMRYLSRQRNPTHKSSVAPEKINYCMKAYNVTTTYLVFTARHNFCIVEPNAKDPTRMTIPKIRQQLSRVSFPNLFGKALDQYVTVRWGIKQLPSLYGRNYH